MSLPAIDRVITFEATFNSAVEAERYLNQFRNKFGHLDGNGCTCSEHGKKGPAGGVSVARVSLSPWHYPPDPGRSVDFRKLLTAANAKEV